jgi:tRNA A-37 threonylcarbamoyl transferase component Bud32
MTAPPDDIRPSTEDGSGLSAQPGARRARVASVFGTGDLVAGRYRVVRFIARGGMGEVYEAEDLELATRVALKTVRAESIGDARAARRVRRELTVARAVLHANVCRLHDIGYHLLPGEPEAEIAFITMELLRGPTLAAHLRERGRLPLTEALPIARGIAAALDALHERQVVHLDLKSQNVMLEPSPDGGAPRVVVTDFGVSRGVDLAATATVEAGGTPAYMPPEQLSRCGPMAPAVDVYALGVVLFEMLTGELPYGAEALAARRVEDEPPSPRRLVPEIGPIVDAVIRRCLAGAPAERFASAGEVIGALEGHEPRWLTRRRRLRARALAGGVLALGGSAGLVVSGLAPARCAALDVDARELHVDARAPAGGSGARACPVTTITAALALAGEDGDKVIHVAAGRYDATLGERFPLVVRGGLSLAGAGAEQTIVAGTGEAPLAPEVGGLSQDPGDPAPRAALLLGDTRRETRVSGITFRSTSPAPLVREKGILCLRGNLTSFTGAAPPPNTHLAGVKLEGFGTAVVAHFAVAPEARGCNLEVVDAEIARGLTGVWQLGCGERSGYRAPTGVRVDRTAFVDLRESGGTGIGILVWDCARRLEVRRSTFSQGDGGVLVIRHGEEPAAQVVIEGNRFDDLTRFGVRLERAAVIDLLADNMFSLDRRGGMAVRAPAVVLDQRGQPPPGFPEILRARGNRFHDNGTGVEVRGEGQIPLGTRIDFGTPEDPGGNHFICNSARAGGAAAGFDVLVALKGAPLSRLSFAGNVWDHAPPTVRLLGAAENGTDVVVAGPAPAIDLSAATGGTTIHCPTGVHGP